MTERRAVSLVRRLALRIGTIKISLDALMSGKMRRRSNSSRSPLPSGLQRPPNLYRKAEFLF
jgi:hypothetical protein